MTTIEIKKGEADFSFEATDMKGHVVKFDTSEETGGINFGVRPMSWSADGIRRLQVD